MKGIQGFSKKGICLVVMACLFSLVIGSIYDYQISSAIFDKDNMLCIFIAAYGQLPVSLGMSVLGTLLIYVCKKTWAIKSIGAICAGCLLNAMALFMCILDPSLYFENMPMFMNVIIACGLVVGANSLTLHFVKDIEKEEIIRFIKFGLFVIIAQLVIINLIKIPWGRGRMRMIVETPDAFFQPWWVVGSSMKQTLMALGVASEEFKSFPSGHTACATCILIFTILPTMKLKTQKYAKRAFAFGLIFAVVVGFSRIVMGAHFLSDITIGFLVSFLLISIAYHHFYGRNLGGNYE